jgi:hypothetical protein
MAWKNGFALVLAWPKKQLLHRRAISFNFGLWKPCVLVDARKQRRYRR